MQIFEINIDIILVILFLCFCELIISFLFVSLIDCCCVLQWVEVVIYVSVEVEK